MKFCFCQNSRSHSVTTHWLRINIFYLKSTSLLNFPFSITSTIYLFIQTKFHKLNLFMFLILFKSVITNTYLLYLETHVSNILQIFTYIYGLSVRFFEEIIDIYNCVCNLVSRVTKKINCVFIFISFFITIDVIDLFKIGRSL